MVARTRRCWEGFNTTERQLPSLRRGQEELTTRFTSVIVAQHEEKIPEDVFYARCLKLLKVVLVRISSGFPSYLRIHSVDLQALHTPQFLDPSPKTTTPLVVMEERLRQYEGVYLPRLWTGCRSKLQPTLVGSQREGSLIHAAHSHKQRVIRGAMQMYVHRLDDIRGTRSCRRI